MATNVRERPLQDTQDGDPLRPCRLTELAEDPDLGLDPRLSLERCNLDERPLGERLFGEGRRLERMRKVTQVVLEREQACEHDRESLEQLLPMGLGQLLEVAPQALQLEAGDEHVLNRAVVEVEARPYRLALGRSE